MSSSAHALPAAHFRRGATPDRHQARRAALVTGLAAGLAGRALDYGCGWGDLTALLAPQFTDIEGVDVAAERVSFAASEYAPIPFRQCAPEDSGRETSSLDVVISTVVLHFVPSPERYIQECHRIVRPGGSLVLTIQNPASMWMSLSRWRKRQEPQASWISGQSEVKVWGGTLPMFRTWLHGLGFTIEREAGFYDPPLDRIRTAGDVVLAGLNTAGHLLSIHGKWSYVGFRCRRTG